METRSVKDSSNAISNILGQIKSYWYLFVISLVIFLGLGYAYITFSTKQFLVSSTMLIQLHPTSPDANKEYANAGVSTALSLAENVKNEGDVLRSRSLMKEVVQMLHLNISYYNKSALGSPEIYEEAPFAVNILKNRTDSLREREYTFSVNGDNTVTIKNEDEGINRKVQFDQKVELPQYDISIAKTAAKPAAGKEYSAMIKSEDQTINSLLAGYDAQFTDKTTTNVEFTFYYPNSKKGEVILHTLMNQYLKDNNANKKRIIDSTINFINARIAVVSNELSDIEKTYQDFRSKNNITDIDEQAKVLVGNSSTYTDRYDQQRVQLSIVNSLKAKLNNPNSTVIPSSLSIQNASFATSLARYNDLVNERERSKLTYTESNPVIQNLNEQIKLAKSNLIQNVDSYKSELEMSTAGAGSQKNFVSNDIKDIPGKQREIVGFKRQQELKQQLYVYLLQKREETEMAKAADMPYSRIVDDAKSSNSPVKPIKPLIFVMSFFLGFVIPLSYINTKGLFINKIQEESDIESQTDVTIIGKIGRVPKNDEKLIDITSRSPVTESFRTLRTKIRNLLDVNRSNVIMVTSSKMGEGKTYLTGNLGLMLAMSGKRVVLVELDLRKPNLSKLIGLDYAENGYTNYVMDDLPISKVLKQTTLHRNCFAISAGPIVANGSELLLTDKLEELITDLRTRFDYVVIDSSPVGLVSDALEIQKYTDMTIFVCRHNYTDKNQIEIINEIKSKDKVDNLYVVINDVDFSKSGYYGYGYGVGYGELVKS
ncbi:polysaccharide biosynthesis tyrosine autokinase [Mucilaginibacter sp. JRF]|uniref:GumC family protein n=1 Tax=Mucilaginibacter sp. JRF TaxID=2780088 RepID=UPI001882BC27|nr:tyrosine-protein kinase [Mucilaginibacter sp. JRF]MBE9585871.1 polysaccharide biosynthesis tyrosine autokinase [Mucilaginibacter sp. JRF]